MAQVTEVSSLPLSFFEDSGSCPPGFQLSPYCSLKTQLRHTSSVMVPWAGVDLPFSPSSLSCSSPWICVSAFCSRSVKNIWCLHVRVLECVSDCAHTHAHTHIRGEAAILSHSCCLSPPPRLACTWQVVTLP